MPPSDERKIRRPARPPDELESESVGMEELLRMYDEKMAEFAEGEIVKGRILKITPTEAIVDIGFKSEGVIPIQEITTYSGELRVKVGEEIDVFVERLESHTGQVLLSKEKAERVKVWDQLEKAFKESGTVKGRVIERVKGGLAVDVGVKAFLPGSLVDVRPVKNLDSFRGQELDFKVISFDKKRNNVVVSRKAIVEVEHGEKKKETLAALEEGKKVRGSVKNITDYGVFVDLGGVDGLLHITDISWGRVNHPSEFFNVGDEIDVVVLKFDSEHERVSLGYKQRTPDPWLDVAERYPIGSRVNGKVVSLTDYGAFVELEEGVEGLIHISEMSWTRRVRPSKILAAGEPVEAVVADVNVSNRRISLSLKALEQNPWATIEERYPVGSTITGRVRNITDFGAFVEVEEGMDGLVHISDMSWTRRLKHPSEMLKKGDQVTARVITVDGENQRLSLSIKEFVPNEWDEYAKAHQIGDEVEGTISKITDFGLFVKLTEGVEGLVHVSEVEREGRLKLDQIFNPGDRVRTRIIKIDWAEKKLGLTMRDVSQDGNGGSDPQEREGRSDEEPPASDSDADEKS
ncbi:MAG TPA: 30S ribosomal protein S1 [Thermoanaerobaculia bacterium]|nr:30S ribosomal protein S1 [Thermoanaerobaculia bacterium]